MLQSDQVHGLVQDFLFILLLTMKCNSIRSTKEGDFIVSGRPIGSLIHLLLDVNVNVDVDVDVDG